MDKDIEKSEYWKLHSPAYPKPPSNGQPFIVTVANDKGAEVVASFRYYEDAQACCEFMRARAAAALAGKAIICYRDV